MMIIGGLSQADIIAEIEKERFRDEPQVSAGAIDMCFVL
jgi:hypothetical protein